MRERGRVSPLRRRGLLEVIEGYYVGHIVHQLNELGAFAKLSEGKSAAILAEELGADARLITTLLEFLYQTTNLLVRSHSGLYKLKSRYGHYYHFGFQIEKFLGVYGPPFLHLRESLSAPTL